jgi:isopentenyldiphosphate isomerase
MEKRIGKPAEVGEKIFTEITTTDGWIKESDGTSIMPFSYSILDTNTISGWEIKYILRRFLLAESLIKDNLDETTELRYCYSYANLKRCEPEQIIIRLCKEKEIIDHIIGILEDNRAKEIAQTKSS